MHWVDPNICLHPQPTLLLKLNDKDPDAVVGKEESAFTHEENLHEEESAHAWRKGTGSGKPRQDLRGPSETYGEILYTSYAGKNAEALDIGHTVGYRYSSCNSLALGTTQWTRDYSSHIACHRSDCDCG